MIHLRPKAHILPVLLIFTALSQAKVNFADKPDKNISCFNDISLPESFIAFDAGFDSELATWYQRLERVKTFTFPDGNTKGVLMKRGKFVVEVFNKKSLNGPAGKSPDIPGIISSAFLPGPSYPSCKAV
ncbi:hypothetical protein [Thalassomonas haliotis]|uniref:Uncharacterized protein n=1 Tax=Thalassomonas haliotis TaxID=485448 RepID=A0ABY7VF32_9GAMM|nr:hypothetical protein [Thalassomonas haliotis]WDE12178.1 hypothetical protein H3N35_01440 [Thalassomonas haliotis]